MTIFSRADKTLGLPHDPGRWKEALEAALRVSEIASSAMGLPEAVKAMVDAATKLLNAEQGSIMLLEDNGRWLVLVASSGLPTQVPLGHRQRVGESVAGRVITTGRPLLLGGDIERDQFVNFVPKSRPISSSVVVPLRAQGRAIGVLSLAIPQGPSAFTDDDVRVAQMFGDQAAGLIHKAKLHERAELRSAGLSALIESSRGLLGTLKPDSLLQHVLDGASRLADSSVGFACLFDVDSGSISKGVFRGLEKPVISALVEHPEVKAAIGEGDARAFEHEELGHLIAVGLGTSRALSGVFLLLLDHAPPSDRVDLLRAFGQQSTSALGAASLYTVVERKESELSSIIQAVPNPIIMVDAWGSIVALNPAAEELFAISAVFSAGAPVKGTLGHPEVEALLTESGPRQAEVSIGTPQRIYRARVGEVQVPGAPLGRVLIMDDVTSEREIARIQRDFVAIIGHELRSPLTIIKGFARTLLRRLDKATLDETREALTTIDGRAGQLERLIEDLLYVSRIEGREAGLRIDEVEVAALAQAAAEELVTSHSDREIAIDIPADLRWPCDRTKIGLVLRHLIENGLKYSEAPAPVMVRAHVEADALRVDVTDRGVGIVSSDVPHIFDRFRQVDSSSTRERGGTGVGLYLCAQLVRVHGGRIWVDSAWGKGSTFSFTLPGRASNEVVRIQGRLRHAPDQDEATGVR